MSERRELCFTFLVAQLLVLRPLPGLDLIRVRVHGFVDGLHHLLLPALRDDQREVLVQLLVAVQKLRVARKRETSVSDCGGYKGERPGRRLTVCRDVAARWHTITENRFSAVTDPH